MTRTSIDPDLLRWACERSGIAREKLLSTFKKLPEWEDGTTQPTLKQVEDFAHRVHVPVGYLFLAKPPEEAVPIPDFRTFAGRAVTRPSPNLLDTIYICQGRQNWYRDFVRAAHQPKLDFVGTATVKTPPETVAAKMRETLGFDLAARQSCPKWEDALRLFIREADKAGVLVMVSGVVGSNNSRPLNTAEFRGFALSDPLAPLIFVNGADTKAAQMFTIAHELAHIWLGTSALSNLSAVSGPGFRREEVWCNAVAAELLVPLAGLQSNLQQDEPLSDALSRLAQTFKVSSLVILRRLLDAHWISQDRFDVAWKMEVKRLQTLAPKKSSSGDFHRTILARVSHRFARALFVSTLEGQTLYRDAFGMLGISKTETFKNLEAKIMG